MGNNKQTKTEKILILVQELNLKENFLAKVKKYSKNNSGLQGITIKNNEGYTLTFNGQDIDLDVVTIDTNKIIEVTKRDIKIITEDIEKLIKEKLEKLEE